MIRHIFIFLGTFVAGAIIALVARAAMFKPQAGHAGHPPGGGDYAPMVSNPLAPAKGATPAATPATPATPAATATPAAPAPAAAPHGAHAPDTAPAPSVAPASTTVNSVCAICGMPVDPKLPMLDYKGKPVGFGCKMCAPKFKADPDKYGPAFLRNEVLK
ncbi:MAG: hypothetical protein HY736_22645 [Verrucomicrobia bacterium]|nr:hypothetical protein [Verrucomicrobiota bacterium]